MCSFGEKTSELYEKVMLLYYLWTNRSSVSAIMLRLWNLTNQFHSYIWVWIRSTGI